MNKTQLQLRLLLLVLTTFACGPAWALSPAGDAVHVVPQAQGHLESQTVMLATGDSIYMGQRVITGEAGSVQVIFNDNTHLVVGPGSTLVIAEYLMRDDGTTSKFVVNALAGTFRFVTGNSPKNAYKIETPTGTLGVRGTAFDFGVDPATGETHVLLYHGGVNVCAADGSCTLLSEACSVGIIPPRASAAVLRKDDHRRSPILQDFPYLASQRPLRADFRVSGVGNCKETQSETRTAFLLVADESTPPRGSSPPTPPSPPSVSPPPIPDEAPPTAPSEEHNNNGFGNGGDSSSEGLTEHNNPGHRNR